MLLAPKQRYMYSVRHQKSYVLFECFSDYCCYIVNESVMKALWEMVVGPLNRCHAEPGFIIF